MTLYLAIGPPPYELPLAVADSPTELGQMIGVSVGCLESHAQKTSAPRDTLDADGIKNVR